MTKAHVPPASSDTRPLAQRLSDIASLLHNDQASALSHESVLSAFSKTIIWRTVSEAVPVCESLAQVQGMRDEIEALRDSVNQDHWKRVLLNKLLALIDAPPKE